MATNSRTGLFVHFRNSYNHQSSSRAKAHSLTGDEEMLIVSNGGGHAHQKRHPVLDVEWHQWIEAKGRLEAQLRTINTSIDRMVEDIGRMRYQNNVFGALHSSHDSASDGITASLSRLKRDLESIRVHSLSSSSSRRAKFQEHWRIAMLKQVVAAGERLIGCQQTVCSRSGGNQQPPIASPATTDQSWGSPSPGVLPYQVYATQYVMARDLEESRGQEYERILRDMRSVVQGTKDIQLVVSEQGTLLDRIDYNLEHAESKVVAAVQEISKRSDAKQLHQRKFVALLLVVLILLTSIVLIVRPKK